MKFLQINQRCVQYDQRDSLQGSADTETSRRKTGIVAGFVSSAPIWHPRQRVYTLSSPVETALSFFGSHTKPPVTPPLLSQVVPWMYFSNHCLPLPRLTQELVSHPSCFVSSPSIFHPFPIKFASVTTTSPFLLSGPCQTSPSR